jgi:hypothetical protein
MMKRALAIALTELMGGCVTGQKMGDIHEGMSKHEVESTLGKPERYQRSGEYEALRYTDRLISGWSWNRTDYTVVPQNGQVIEYGPGQVRQEGPMTPRPRKASLSPRFRPRDAGGGEWREVNRLCCCACRSGAGPV